MAQHFLLSSKARTLSLRDIYKGGEEAAREPGVVGAVAEILLVARECKPL